MRICFRCRLPVICKYSIVTSFCWNTDILYFGLSTRIEGESKKYRYSTRSIKLILDAWSNQFMFCVKININFSMAERIIV